MNRSARRSVTRLLTLGVVFGGAAEVAALDAGTFANPIIGDGQDPWVIQHQGLYYYTWSANNQVFVSESRRLEEIGSAAPKAIFQPPPGTPYSQEVWAPELHRLGDRWYLYVAADDGDNANHRMYVLESNSSDPLGSYTFKGQITDPTNKWAIDGTVWDRGPGERYFIWSGWEGDVNVRQKLYIAPMSDPWTISGPRVEISTPEFGWERVGDPDVNEGPQVLTRDGVTHVIYSASGAWTDDYKLGQLTFTGDDPLDPASWSKRPEPVFQRTADVFGPGHASFVQSPDETEDWIVFHAAKHQGSGFDRNVRMQPFTFRADGSPDFGSPVSPGVPLALPSGFSQHLSITNGSFERDHVVTPGQPGFALSAEGFEKAGSVQVLANDGRFFTPIEGGEGPQVAAIARGAEGENGLRQNLGPLRPGTYRVSAGLALSDDQLAAAQGAPGDFVLRLTALPRRGGEQPVTLGEVAVGSGELSAQAFRFFETQADIGVTSALLGRDLELSLHSAGAAAGGPFWQAKVDALSLEAQLAPPATPRVDLNFSGQGDYLGATGFESLYGGERADFSVGGGRLTIRTLPSEDTFGRFEGRPDDATNVFFSAIDPLDRTVVEASVRVGGLGENFQGGGIWLGTDQDHYIRLGVIHNDLHPQGPVVLEVLRENEELWPGAGGPGGDITIEQLALPDAQPVDIVLRLVRDGDTARAFFSLDDGASFQPIGGVFDAITTSEADGASVEGGFKVGVYAFGGQTPGAASFGFDWFSAVSTIAGDLNGDGFVGAGDLDRLLAQWNQPAEPGSAVDLNGDGFVGAGDLDRLLANWNRGAPPPAASAPEPGTAAALAAAALAALGRRARRRAGA